MKTAGGIRSRTDGRRRIFWAATTTDSRPDPIMVLDTSASLAILLAEPRVEAMVRALAAAESRILGAPTLVEASAVMQARKGPGGDLALDALLRRIGAQVVPMSDAAVSLARLAYGRFGKGVGDPGVLNYGDCLVYGVAMSLGEPLLFKGDAFRRTDITLAAY